MATKSVDIPAVFQRTLQLEGQAILDCAQNLDSSELTQACQSVHQSLIAGGKIVVTGIGKSGKVGQKIAATLSSTGSLAVFLHPTEGLHGDLGLVTDRDVVLALSHSGNTEELLQLIPSLKKLGVRIIGLGANPSSRLGSQCDFWIKAPVAEEACPHNLAPTTSTTLALALGDALAVTLMQIRGFDVESFARYHPGGSLAKRMKFKVRDLMITGKRVGVVTPNASMEEVIIEATEKKLGGVLVAEGTRLVGLITDGDIRRALKAREKFFQKRASEVMTEKPIVLDPDADATQALHLMENRESQIGVLPVTDTDGNWKGLLRLHDLVQNL